MTPVHEIQQAVADTFGISLKDMNSSCRMRFVAQPRQVAMLIARDHTGYSLARLGRLFGRDHSTVLHGIHIAEQRIATDFNLARTVHRLEKRFPRPNPPEPPRVASSVPCQRCGARPGMCGHGTQRLLTAFSA